MLYLCCVITNTYPHQLVYHIFGLWPHPLSLLPCISWYPIKNKFTYFGSFGHHILIYVYTNLGIRLKINQKSYLSQKNFGPLRNTRGGGRWPLSMIRHDKCFLQQRTFFKAEPSSSSTAGLYKIKKAYIARALL